jgi:nucleotide-binding universal stress UspA family protein
MHRLRLPQPTEQVLALSGYRKAQLVVVHAVSRDGAVAGERKAEFIVLGATRHAGLRRRFLGSTALRVSRRSSVPVLVLSAIHVKRALSRLDEAVLGWAA